MTLQACCTTHEEVAVETHGTKRKPLRAGTILKPCPEGTTRTALVGQGRVALSVTGRLAAVIEQASMMSESNEMCWRAILLVLGVLDVLICEAGK